VLAKPLFTMAKYSKQKPKRYFLHYKKGKYILVNLDLKKKGHEQRYWQSFWKM